MMYFYLLLLALAKPRDDVAGKEGWEEKKVHESGRVDKKKRVVLVGEPCSGR